MDWPEPQTIYHTPRGQRSNASVEPLQHPKIDGITVFHSQLTSLAHLQSYELQAHFSQIFS